jgi:hypothetical protein
MEHLCPMFSLSIYDDRTSRQLIRKLVLYTWKIRNREHYAVIGQENWCILAAVVIYRASIRK